MEGCIYSHPKRRIYQFGFKVANSLSTFRSDESHVKMATLILTLNRAGNLTLELIQVDLHEKMTQTAGGYGFGCGKKTDFFAAAELENLGMVCIVLRVLVNHHD